MGREVGVGKKDRLSSSRPMLVHGQTAPPKLELRILLQDSSVSALELSKLQIESSQLPSLVASLKNIQVAAEAGNFMVQEFLQRSKARRLLSSVGTSEGSDKDSIWSLLSSKAES